MILRVIMASHLIFSFHFTPIHATLPLHLFLSLHFICISFNFTSRHSLMHHDFIHSTVGPSIHPSHSIPLHSLISCVCTHLRLHTYRHTYIHIISIPEQQALDNNNKTGKASVHADAGTGGDCRLDGLHPCF